MPVMKRNSWPKPRFISPPSIGVVATVSNGQARISNFSPVRMTL